MQDIGIVFKRPEIYTLLFLTYLQVLTFKKKSYLSSTALYQASRPGQKKARSAGARIGFAIEILFLQAVATHWLCKEEASLFSFTPRRGYL